MFFTQQDGSTGDGFGSTGPDFVGRMSEEIRRIVPHTHQHVGRDMGATTQYHPVQGLQGNLHTKNTPSEGGGIRKEPESSRLEGTPTLLMWASSACSVKLLLRSRSRVSTFSGRASTMEPRQSAAVELTCRSMKDTMNT